MRAAVVGAGFMGRVHARAVARAGGVVAVVAASTPERAAQAAPVLRAERAGTVSEAVVADDVDVVHICTPNHLHRELAEKALSAGKHVICEKPLATDLTSAQAMASAVPAGLVASVPFVYRFYSTVREAKGRVRAGALGPIHLVHGQYLQDWLSRASDDNWRVRADLGGSSRAFADIGVHWCDLVEFITGHRIVRLVATTKVVFARGAPSQPTEDAATLLFAMDNGAIGSLTVSQVSPGRKNRLWLEIDGTDAALSFDQEAPESLWVGDRDQSHVVMRGSDANRHSGRYNVVPVGHPQGYQDCFDAYVADVYDAIGGSPPEGLPVFADGVRAAALTDTVLASARTGAWMDVAK